MRMGVMLRLEMAPTIPRMGESWVDALLLACLVSFAPRAGLPQGELRTPVGACWLFSPGGGAPTGEWRYLRGLLASFVWCFGHATAPGFDVGFLRTFGNKLSGRQDAACSQAVYDRSALVSFSQTL